MAVDSSASDRSNFKTVLRVGLQNDINPERFMWVYLVDLHAFPGINLCDISKTGLLRSFSNPTFNHERHLLERIALEGFHIIVSYSVSYSMMVFKSYVSLGIRESVQIFVLIN